MTELRPPNVTGPQTANICLQNILVACLLPHWQRLPALSRQALGLSSLSSPPMSFQVFQHRRRTETARHGTTRHVPSHRVTASLPQKGSPWLQTINLPWNVAVLIRIVALLLFYSSFLFSLLSPSVPSFCLALFQQKWQNKQPQEEEPP